MSRHLTPPPSSLQAIRDRAGDKIAGGKIIKVEAHPIPEHPRPRRVVGRVALVGDAAGYVTKCSGTPHCLKPAPMLCDSVC